MDLYDRVYDIFKKIVKWLNTNEQERRNAICELSTELSSKVHPIIFTKRCHNHNIAQATNDYNTLICLIRKYYEKICHPSHYQLTESFYVYFRSASILPYEDETKWLECAPRYYRNMYRGLNELLNFELLTDDKKKEHDQDFVVK